VLISCIIFSSCSSKLSRGKAADILQDFYEYPNVEVSAVNLEGFGGGRNEDVLKNAANMGLMSTNNDEWAAFATGGNGNVYSLTSKADMFISQTQMGLSGLGSIMAITNCRAFNEVTRVTENPQTNTAEVEFSCKRKGITPFGTILGYKEGDISNYKVIMTHSDDGWRITDNKQNIKPDKYFFFNKDGDYNCTGLYKKLDKNGTLVAELNYKDGKLNGKCVGYYNGTQKKMEKMYKDDAMDGQYIEYYINGQKMVEGNYSNNKRDGDYKYFRDNGSLQRTMKFNGDVLDANSIVLYDEQGQKIDISKYLIGTWKSQSYYQSNNCTVTLTFVNDHNYNIVISAIDQYNNPPSKFIENGEYSISFNTNTLAYQINRNPVSLTEFAESNRPNHLSGRPDKVSVLDGLNRNSFNFKSNFSNLWGGYNLLFTLGNFGEDLTFQRQ
jgi:antitoxin component YwqK of YwqJK toxin-antitoxin module